ncbi:hypothetical protein LTR78_002750 [Recurvomyces mirabilis]|uniref:C2H2-type domain-containing protein n=1 Tax=Recurvomyces mirabilis TaxID=574656 RepID=A0AAE1C3Y9_9PEZI|nr:hypothetical protein LTR78_002750 [Recurvomyces mirabilis]KAK5159515.1 hypothetical protein LTS14_002657 [Recurvomyces mirabilis]
MSNYQYNPPQESPEEEDEFRFPMFDLPTTTPVTYDPYGSIPVTNTSTPHFFHDGPAVFQDVDPFQGSYELDSSRIRPWATPVLPSNYPLPQTLAETQSSAYNEPFNTYRQNSVTAGPSYAAAGYLSPDEAGMTRTSRATSFVSTASSAPSLSRSDMSRSVSPTQGEMARWGVKQDDGSWKCAYQGCTSKSIFHRGCDLRKHFKRHTKTLFCRHRGCNQATGGGFSSKKDRARHEASHNPTIVCEWDGCNRLFSRVDNMKDHVRRVHKKRTSE